MSSYVLSTTRWIAGALCALTLASCGDSVRFFTLRVIGSEPVAEGGGITLDAVDEIRISIDPPENIDFDMRPEVVYEDGQVRSRVSVVGEFIIELSREYVQANATRNEVGFSLNVPMTMESAMVGDLPDPGLFVEVIQRNADGTETLGSFRRSLSWPLENDAVETVTVRCAPGLEAKCLNERP